MRIKVITATVILILAVAGCGFLKQKVEQKVNEKIDETIDESQRKLDSVLEANNPDSINAKIDSLLESSGKQLDSMQKSLDSLNIKQKKKNK